MTPEIAVIIGHETLVGAKGYRPSILSRGVISCDLKRLAVRVLDYRGAKIVLRSRRRTVVQPIKRSVSYLQNPLIGPLLFTKLLNGVPSLSFSTILPLILANKLNFSAAELGYYMSVNSNELTVFLCYF
jgi:hypothetical protein